MADKQMRDQPSAEVASSQRTPPEYASDEVLNASGHVQELSRNFSVLSLAGVGVSVGNVWPAIGGSILVALYNGGPPGTPTAQVDAYRLMPNRCAVRIHRGFNILLDRCRLYRGAGLCYSIICWRLSMGVSHSWSQMGSYHRLLCWVLELACLGVRSRIIHPHFRQSKVHCQLRHELMTSSPTRSCRCTL